MYDILPRTEARKRGLIKYFTGIACKKYHIAQRYTSTGLCVKCTQMAQTTSRQRRIENNIIETKGWFYGTFRAHYQDKTTIELYIEILNRARLRHVDKGIDRILLQMTEEVFTRKDFYPKPLRRSPNLKIITRRQAFEQGLKRFYTGKKCHRFHDSERYVASGNCVECHANEFRLNNNRRYEWNYPFRCHPDDKDTIFSFAIRLFKDRERVEEESPFHVAMWETVRALYNATEMNCKHPRFE